MVSDVDKSFRNKVIYQKKDSVLQLKDKTT